MVGGSNSLLLDSRSITGGSDILLLDLRVHIEPLEFPAVGHGILGASAVGAASKKLCPLAEP